MIGIAAQLVAHLVVDRAIALAKPRDVSPAQPQSSKSQQLTSRIDKSVLTIGETKRIRCKGGTYGS